MQTTQPASKKHWITPAITAIRTANTAESGTLKVIQTTEAGLGVLLGPAS